MCFSIALHKHSERAALAEKCEDSGQYKCPGRSERDAADNIRRIVDAKVYA
jgi:hypothetical protein